nr:hypothetical protein [Tanacetum cinerariifolium]
MNNGNPLYQERRQTMEESQSKFMAKYAKRHEENSNLIKEIQASTDAAIKNQGASIKGLYGLKDLVAYSIGTTLLDVALPTKKKDRGNFTFPCIINNLCFNKALDDLGASVSVMPFSTYTKLGLGELDPTKLIVELAYRTVKHPKGIAKAVVVTIDKFVFPVNFVILDMPEDIKILLILGILFLSTTHAKIDVVNVLILREMMELDLEARLMREALILNRSLDLLYGDYIELNYLTEPLELRRNQVDDLEPTIKEGYEHVNANFFPLLSINVMSRKFYNSILKDKVEYKGRNVVGAFMNVPIFLGKFSVMTDFTVIDDIDSYRDEEMGDIIVGRSFCK